MGVLYQIIGTAIICTMSVNIGILFAWPAFTINLFQSQNTTLNRPMTDTESALFGSLSSIGALIGTPCSAYGLEKIGRKNSTIINSLGIVIVWVMILLSKQVEVILTAVFLSGINTTSYVIGTVYISEICQDSIRGSMTAMIMVSYGFGVLLSYLLGGFLNYYMMLYIGLTLAVASVGLLMFLKESPMHLLSQSKEKEALQSIAYYRRLEPDSKEAIKVLNTMKKAFNEELDDLTPEQEKLKPEMESTKKLTFWQFVKKSRSSRNAFFVSLFVMTAATFQGLGAVLVYAETLFSEAIPTASPALCSVMLAVSIVVAGLVAAYLTDVAGRKSLMIYASTATGISCLILGTQLHFHWGPNWVTAIFLYVFPVTYTCGAGTVPYVVMAEVFLPEVKSVFSMVLVEYTWLCYFVLLFIVNPLMKTLGWGPVFYIFAIICFVTTAFCMVFLPETKGLTVDEIQGKFTKKRKAQNLY